jgi:hypothetical protein
VSPLKNSDFNIPAVHGCCCLSGFATMADPLRVKAGIQSNQATGCRIKSGMTELLEVPNGKFLVFIKGLSNSANCW